MTRAEQAEGKLQRAVSRLKNGEDIETYEIMIPLVEFVDAKIAEALEQNAQIEHKTLPDNT